MPCSVRSGPHRFLVVLALLALSAAATAQSAPAAADSGQQVTHVLGLDGVKRGAKGTLTVSADGLKFKSAASNAAVAIASVEDIATDQDSRQSGGKFLTVAKMGIPYGGGRVLSLFTHEKFDSLTIEYRDANGALHGALFTMPMGQANGFKKQLVAVGAKSSTPVMEPAPATDAAKKEKQ